MLHEMGGAFVIDADDIARRVQSPGGSAYDEIVRVFGPGVVRPDGALDRRALAAEVFSRPERLEQLNRIVHPRVREAELELLDSHRGDGLVVLNVPLLLENGMESLVDRVVVVTVGDQARKARLWERSRMPAEEVDRRLAAQMPQQEKVRRAHDVIDNDGPVEETRRQVRELLERLGVAPGAPHDV